MARHFVPPRLLIDFVESRGFKAMPVTNCQQAIQEGVELRICGYELLGPRGNRTVVAKDQQGLLPLDHAEAWCDGVDFATHKINQRKSSRS